MKKPKVPVAGHYIPCEFAEQVSGELVESHGLKGAGVGVVM